MVVHVVVLASHVWIDAIAAAMIAKKVNDTNGCQRFY